MSTTPLHPDAKPVPENDGVDHLNVYSKAKTALGRELSNLAHVALNHPKYGFFASMEAYWYWIKSGMKHDQLRRLYGMTAKTAGIRETPVMIDDAVFKDLIRDGLRLKVVQNSKLCEALRQSSLPLRHYYVYGSNPPVVHSKRDHQWQMECLEDIRRCLQEEKPILLSDGSPVSPHHIKEIPENPVPEDMQRFVEE